MARSRILVAVSSPWASQKMAAPVVALATRLDAQVVVAHVSEMLEEDETETDARKRGEQTLAVLTDALKEAGVEAEGVMLLANDVAKAILNTTKARDCGMIVVGLTGKGIFKRIISGDVSYDILRQTEVPVLVCPANWAGVL